MKLEINLSDETSFLNEIKKFIMGIVKNISRSEFETQIKEIYTEKLKPSFPSETSIKSMVDKITHEEIKKQITDALGGSSGWSANREPLKKLIQEEIARQVKEMIDKKQF